MKNISESTLETIQLAEKEISRLARLRNRAKTQKTKERHEEAILNQLPIVLDCVAQAFSELT